ncbi:hypothetical protein KIPB_006938 [Kipferlia bialata]|uniref:Uncharacterized protein n=1 Tax=Kipferlia bialata TaxID=797122 RepID=A0A9K3CZ92_9EUKA|nr:hypothetical protein KIPB_006938 [Kipferlia bialata]|eukprot:g6938.t1
MPDATPLFVSHSSTGNDLRAVVYGVNCQNNMVVVCGWQSKEMYTHHLLSDGSVEQEMIHSGVLKNSGLFYIQGVLYVYVRTQCSAFQLDTPMHPPTPLNVTLPDIQDLQEWTKFTLDSKCYLVVTVNGSSGMSTSTWCYDPEAVGTGWVCLPVNTPHLVRSHIPLPVIGNRAYTLTKRGQSVSFSSQTGWSADESAPILRGNCHVMAVGQYLLLSKTPPIIGRSIHRWYKYDTISGELQLLPEILHFGCGHGLFSPALAVRSYPDKVHVLNARLVYPHSELEWGITPPGQVVTDV